MTTQPSYSIAIIGLVLSLAGCAAVPSIHAGKKSEYEVFLEPTAERLDKAKVAEKQTMTGADARILAQQAREQGDTDQALFYYVKALERDNKDIIALLAIAAIHADRGNTDLAVRAYTLALDVDEVNVAALEGMGVAMIRKARYEEAQGVLLRALAVDPRRPRLFNGLAVIADLSGDFATAAVYYRAALELEPNSVMLLSNFGYSRYLAGDWPQAESLYIEALGRDAGYSQTILNLGLLEARRGELFEAQQTLERVLAPPQAYNELGYILMLDKHYDQAEQLFQRAISSSPSYFAQAHANLAQLRALRQPRAPKP